MKKLAVVLGSILCYTGLAGSVNSEFLVTYQPFGINTFGETFSMGKTTVTDITKLIGERREVFVGLIDRASDSECKLDLEGGFLKMVDGGTTTEVDSTGCASDGKGSRKMSPEDFKALRIQLDELLPGSERVNASQLGRKSTFLHEPRGSVMGREFEAMQLAWAHFQKNRKGSPVGFDDVVISAESLSGKDSYGGYFVILIPDAVPVIVVMIEPRLMITRDDLNIVDGPENSATYVFKASDLSLIGAKGELRE